MNKARVMSGPAQRKAGRRPDARTVLHCLRRASDFLLFFNNTTAIPQGISKVACEAILMSKSIKLENIRQTIIVAYICKLFTLLFVFSLQIIDYD